MTTPIVTRQAIFKHILTNILEVPVDEEIWTLVIVAEKCRSITDFVSLDRADFEQPFAYTPSGGTQAQTTLSRTQVKMLLELQLFIKANIQDPTFDWMPVTPDDFDSFRVSLVVTQPTGSATANPPPGATGTCTSTSTSSGTMLTARKALVRRQYSDYKEINKRHNFQSWSVELEVTAITHNCVNPLDENYIPDPNSNDALECWKEDQAFMLGVFMNKVKYTSGVKIVADHAKTKDAQGAYRALKADATSAMVTQINEVALEDSLRGMDASKDKWHQTLEAFLDKFQVKLSQLNESRVLVKSVKGHPEANQYVNAMQQLTLHEQRKNSSYVVSTEAFIDGLRISFQQYDRDNKPTRDQPQSQMVNGGLTSPIPSIRADTATRRRSKLKQRRKSTRRKSRNWAYG
jgi:hypothetical protein